MAFDINQHLAQAGFGRGGPGAGADEFKANEDESAQIIVSGMNKSLYTAIKLVGAIPIVGQFLSMLLPANPGTVSLFAGMEAEGLAGKQIRVGSGGPQGGVLAKIAGELMKNSAITDHTAGVGMGGDGGGGGGGGGDSGGGGGESMGGQSGFDSGFSGMDMAPVILAGGGNRFDYSDMPRSMLGELVPSQTPSLIGGRGMGMEM
jgi:hypothetical protein